MRQSIRHGLLAVGCKLDGSDTELDEDELKGRLMSIVDAIPQGSARDLLAAGTVPFVVDERLRSERKTLLQRDLRVHRLLADVSAGKW